MGDERRTEPDEPRTLVGAVRALLLRLVPRPPPGGVRFFRPKAIRNETSVVAEVRTHGAGVAFRRLLPTSSRVTPMGDAS
jgi:hypothetical protein